MKKQYLSYKESLDTLYQMEKDYPDLISIIKIGTTFEGRDIVLAKVSKNVENSDNKPAMLYTGSIHAREWIGHELALKFIEFVAQNQTIDPILEKSLNEATLYMVPCLNPDGYEYSRNHFSFWRKNRRVNDDKTIGVDLNRNFSIGFTQNKDTNSNVYGGEEAFSEAETKAIKEFVDTHPNITMAFDYHSQGNVFFPAHKFTHEGEIDGTDMNAICANMNDEFSKVTGRKYGIHRGKPPAKLISGSGREYYYSKGILAVVVEVGTKNIPDYMKSMNSSINENIPALKYAFSEVVNFSTFAPVRVENFIVKSVDATSIELDWQYEIRDDIYFEIYRSTKDKDACNERTRIAIVGSNNYIDENFSSSTNYHYTIRAVNKNTGYKSPFAPIVKVRTGLEDDEFFKLIFASKLGTGYVSQKLTSEQNKSHFGTNSLFVGINKSKGICNSIVSFDLSSLPHNAVIKTARFYIYPMNRVNAKIEKFGEWNVSLLEEDISDIGDFQEIENASSKGVIGRAIQSSKLTQGIWNHWTFSKHECRLLQELLNEQKAIFRVDGPKTLPDGEDSQLMQFDIGYGQFGGGIHYRPILDITYTKEKEEFRLQATKKATVCSNQIEENILKSGFDEEGNRVYAYMDFDLSKLPNPKEYIITKATFEIKNRNTFKSKSDVRYYMEFVEVEGVTTYENIKSREKIEYIGYEVAEEDLKSSEAQYFKFDTLAKSMLNSFHKERKKVQIVIKPTSALGVKERIVEWNENVSLKVWCVEKLRTPPKPVENLKISKENSMIKLNWDEVKDENVNGYYVVRNSFHTPEHFMDGVKLYGGKDTYTYDNFGSFDKEKYYAVFAYDNVPNFSEAKTIQYSPLEKY